VKKLVPMEVLEGLPKLDCPPRERLRSRSGNSPSPPEKERFRNSSGTCQPSGERLRNSSGNSNFNSRNPSWGRIRGSRNPSGSSRQPSGSMLKTLSSPMPLTDLLHHSVSSITGRLTNVINRSFSRASSDSGFISSTEHPSSPPTPRSSLPHSPFASRRQSLLSDCPSYDDEDFGQVKIFTDSNVEDSYNLTACLGSGAFSTVYLAECKENKGGMAAVKVINKESLCEGGEDKLFLVDKEIEIMAQLDHPGIVKLYEVYENDKEVCLVMELAKGGEVFDRLCEEGCLNEADAADTISQLLSVIHYLHDMGIVHRDLKPENMLYYDNKTDSKIMLTDFGLSEYLDQLNPDSVVCGTPTYLSPEVIQQTNSSTAQDMWSCGVICYILLCGYPPFCKADDETGTEVMDLVVEGKWVFHSSHWDDISLPAKNFVQKLLTADPRKRYTCQQALDHEWIKCKKRGESTLDALLQGFIIMIATVIIFFIYFYILSTYFGIEYRFVSWFESGIVDAKDMFGGLVHKMGGAMDWAWTLGKTVVHVVKDMAVFCQDWAFMSSNWDNLISFQE